MLSMGGEGVYFMWRVSDKTIQKEEKEKERGEDVGKEGKGACK